MKDPTHYRRNLPHILEPDAPHFITCRTLGKCKLNAPERDIVFKHCLAGDGFKFWLHSFVVMPTHVHMLFTPLHDDSRGSFTLAAITKGIKGAPARRINQLHDAAGSVWQDESFDSVISSDSNFDSKALYIMENPVAAGLARSPHDYPWYWTEALIPNRLRQKKK